jgi:hypothetical protein
VLGMSPAGVVEAAVGMREIRDLRQGNTSSG